MVKKNLIIATALLASITANSQDFLGLSTGNYAGITGVHIQPASIADSRYMFDINLSSVSLGFKSNFVGFDRSFAVSNRFNFKGIDNFYDFRNKTLSPLKLAPGEKGYFDVTNTYQVPMSFMLTTGKKGAIALNMRTRTAFAAQNLPNEMIGLLFDINPTTTAINTNIPANGLNLRGVSWLDAGLTLARTVVNTGKHFVKVGITGKYIGGLSSQYLIADQLNIDVKSPSDVYINSNGSPVQYGHSPTNFNVRPENYRPDASSFGFDAGIVYEFRGRINNFKVGKLNDKGEIVSKLRRDKNKYTFRLGASIVDAGSMAFTSSDKAKDFTVNNTFDFTNAGINDVATFDNFVNSKVANYTSNTLNDYTIALPTAYNIQADLHIIKGIYVNGMYNKATNFFNKDVTFRTFTPEYLAITPRWETRMVGLYVPFVQRNLSNLKTTENWNIGTTVRLGPVFAGTNNLATLFKSTSVNEADVHFGVKLPLGYGRPSKAFQKLNKIRKEVAGDTTKSMIDQVIENNEKTAAREEKIDSLVSTGVDVKTIPVEVIAPNVDMEKLAELELKLKDAEEKLKAAELKLNTVPAVITTPTTVEPKAEKNAKPTVAPAEDKQPVKIIINNYNSPAGGNSQSIETEGGSLDQEIELLKQKIELKEKLLKELKKVDGSNGCIELKKKSLA